VTFRSGTKVRPGFALALPWGTLAILRSKVGGSVVVVSMAWLVRYDGMWPVPLTSFCQELAPRETESEGVAEPLARAACP